MTDNQPDPALDAYMLGIRNSVCEYVNKVVWQEDGPPPMTDEAIAKALMEQVSQIVAIDGGSLNDSQFALHCATILSAAAVLIKRIKPGPDSIILDESKAH